MTSAVPSKLYLSSGHFSCCNSTRIRIIVVSRPKALHSKNVNNQRTLCFFVCVFHHNRFGMLQLKGQEKKYYNNNNNIYNITEAEEETQDKRVRQMLLTFKYTICILSSSIFLCSKYTNISVIVVILSGSTFYSKVNSEVYFKCNFEYTTTNFHFHND